MSAEAAPMPPTRVGVYGGGRMGAGIAHAFLLAGSRVIVVENSVQTAEAARERVRTSLAKAEQRGTLVWPVDAVLERLETVTDPAALAPCMLVVEAVPEDAALKLEVLSRVAAIAPLAWLGTNTSSLSVTEIATDLPDPSRMIGLHFFNPVPASDLVEIVVGDRTAQELIDLARHWVTALGKTAITVFDSPGFASSRLGVALALEAIRMVEEGIVSAEDVDTAMTLGYRHPTGPLRTTDIVGLDVRLAIAEHLAKELGPRFEPPQLLRTMVAEGKLGRKSGQGFYRW